MIRKILTAALPLLILLAIPFFLRPKQQDRTPVLLEERLPAVSITLDDLDGFLFQLIKQHRMTNREAILMHQTFDALYKEIDDEAKRLAVISRILRHLNTH